MTAHAHGSPSWFELATHDQSAAKHFYGALFGWTFEDNPMGEGSVYTMFKLGGRDVAAAYTLDPQQAAQGVPPNWSVYFKADDADATLAKVVQGGEGGAAGKVHMPAFDVGDYVRMAVCADTEDAVFCLYQPKGHPGVAAIREPNAICWAELATRDVPRAEAFYAGLFGWTLQTHEHSPTLYRMFGNGDGMLGGLLQMTPEWGEMPSHWSIYIQVEDVDAVVATALANGGELCFPAFDAPGVGRIARINDPAGAGFYIIKFVPEIEAA
jgi:predicted enzyme related to lactoylglutathione lyase